MHRRWRQRAHGGKRAHWLLVEVFHAQYRDISRHADGRLPARPEHDGSPVIPTLESQPSDATTRPVLSGCSVMQAGVMGQ